MTQKMIPFGKYKGQPLEVLEHDPQYAEWIAQQQWAKERYPQIVNVIINKFGENEETPDHNAMQAKFMCQTYRGAAAFVLILRNESICITSQSDNPFRLSWRMEDLEKEMGLLVQSGEYVGIRFISEPPETFKDLVSETVRFEANAIDVCFTMKSTERVIVEFGPGRRNHYGIGLSVAVECSIELKPVVSDDYPAIIRQMRNNKSRFLIYGEYKGVGVDEETFKEFFRSQGFCIAKVAEIESAIHNEKEIISNMTSKFVASVNSLKNKLNLH